MMGLAWRWRTRSWPRVRCRILQVMATTGSGCLRRRCGLLHPLAGQVHVLGHVPDPRSGAQRAAVATDLGQESFFPTLTVAEPLRMG